MSWIDGTPCAVKAACTVWTGGKAGNGTARLMLTYRYSFFTDPTISTLTSGTPSQNVDLGGLSFPRRFGVRFNSDFLKRYHLVGMQCIWDAFEDVGFKKQLDKLFHHEDMVTREGWARYYFDGKFKNETSYVRLQIKNPSSGLLIRTFYFRFKKSYQTSLDGRVYVKDPVLEEKIVKNGILTELKPFKTKKGEIVYKPAKTMFEQEKIADVIGQGPKEKTKVPAIINKMAQYAEKPKMVFLVTPPHLMKYAKLILILIKQLVDLNFEGSYMTKSSQKPLYKTRYMLDELGRRLPAYRVIGGYYNIRLNTRKNLNTCLPQRSWITAGVTERKQKKVTG